MSPGSVTVAPDGARAAFALTAIVGDTYVTSIHVVPTDGSAPPAKLTDGPRDAAPVWSPDGASIAFLRAGPDGMRQLHVMPAAGGEARRLTDHPLGVGSPVTARHARGLAAPVWSPDSRRIAYTARIPDPVAAGRGGARRITRLRYRIDELGYVHDRPSQIFVVGLHGGAPKSLGPEGYDHWDVSWHPDGAHVVAATARHEDRDLDEANDIVVLGLDGTTRCLTRTSTTVNLPTAAPDGRSIYFVGIGLDSDLNDARARNVGLWRVPYEGGAPERLTDAETIDLDDGRTRPLVFTKDGVLGGNLHRGAVHLVSIDADGGTRQIIGGAGQVVEYAAANGVIAAVITKATSAGEVVVVRDGRERVLTEFGAGLAEAGLRGMHEIAAASPDGYPVHGWLVLPDGPGPHPVLLLVHGGPDVQTGYSLFDEAQVYASAGYAVIQTNPRGSAGYGEAHARAIRGRLGTVDADDLMALLAVVAERPDIDSGRIGVLGGSYGGFMTAWLTAHHGERFRAAICERGVYAWESMIGTSDVGLAAMSMIGTDPARWPAQTPLAFADRIQTPMLILHWEGDMRVPFEQAQRFYSALRARRRTVELVVFPGGNHNSSRTGPPAQRIARFAIILDWFGRHLRSA
ncbi:MAG: S9 family peptidase [Rhodospirillaceae bacterium]|nr:S9 family peptidase [Rhodospirillaceae bacterium]